MGKVKMDKVLQIVEYMLVYLEKQGEASITSLKLQKLLYYTQAWSLVWDDTPIFENEIQAWANGPVVADVFDLHQSLFRVSKVNFSKHFSQNLESLKPNEIETIESVLKFYGKKSGYELSQLTHQEDPWKSARKNARLNVSERGDAEITHASMHMYYSSLIPN